MCNLGVNRRTQVDYQQVASPVAKPKQVEQASSANNTEQTINTKSEYTGKKGAGRHGSAVHHVSIVDEKPKEPIDANKLLASLPKDQESSKFYSAVSKVLANPEKREALIKHFDLNSPANTEALKVATFMEGGGSSAYNAKLTAEIIMNRAITIGIVEGKSTIRDVVKKPDQFEINNTRTMHRAGLKTFDEVMALKSGTQYENSMSDEVDKAVKSVMSGQRAEKGSVHYGFKGNGVRNIPDTTRIDRGTVRCW